ncbi:hypothetical protein BDM02DRAFT_3188328 [Thelephora ganbajun]|uniref:Uncharacterized protein n=1 Tax=Thelephora ganbajun TaxID=370292 RepID=A0ACB6ZBF1_THEGA|nr:hypothetical protein BDM02DRAFT_3188328 [Thelephora ganbajun]
MPRHDQSSDSGCDILSTGRKTKHNTDNSDNKDNLYFHFSKQVHQRYLGFGTMGSAFFTRNMINNDLVQAANEDKSTRSLSRLKTLVAKHKKENSAQYHLMVATVIKTMSEFLDIRDNLTLINNSDKEAPGQLTYKLKQAKVDRGEIVIEADEWPAFLYDEEEYNKTKEWLGLFLGEMFMRGCICILIGPSAAQEWPYHMPSSKTYAISQKKGNTELNNITEITPEVVAGLVCQVTFTLSDAGSWKDRIGDIDLIELYTNTVRMLSMDLKWVDKTLDTLQSWILGEKVDEEQEDRDEVAKERFKNLEEMMHMAESEDRRSKDRARSMLSPQGMEDTHGSTTAQNHTTAGPSTRPGKFSVTRICLVSTDKDTCKRASRQPTQRDADEGSVPHLKWIQRRPSTPPVEEDDLGIDNDELNAEDDRPGLYDNASGSDGNKQNEGWATPTPSHVGPQVAKPSSSSKKKQPSRKSQNNSMDSTTFQTSPPSIPPSAQFETQGPVPSSHPSQRPRTTSRVSQDHGTSQALDAQHEDQEAGENDIDPQTLPLKIQHKCPMLTYKDNGLASTTCVSQTPIPRSKFAPHLSQTPVSAPQKTQSPAPPVCSTSQAPSVQANGSQMPPPKTLQKCKASTSKGDNDGGFGDSPLTQSPLSGHSSPNTHWHK